MKTKSNLPPEFWQELEASPHKHSFYNLLRWVDACVPMRKRLGRNISPSHDPLRLRQEPALTFAPSTISQVKRPEGRPPEVSFLHFGLFGPNGPLPLHLTELARERLIHHRDPTIAAFADIFHHRLLTLFYRAWADAQPTVSLDRPNDDFSRYISSLIHIGFQSLNERDSLMDHAKLHYSGHFVRQSRNPEGLISVLRSFFNIEAQLQEFIVHWVAIEPLQQTQLGGDKLLGKSTLLGRAVRDAHTKFRLILGPLTQAQYDSFLPGSAKSQQLLDWVHQYTGVELNWDAVLVLRQEDVQGIQLGQHQPLGLSSWLGQHPPTKGDAKDLIVDYEYRHYLAQQALKTPTNQEKPEFVDHEALLIA